MRALIQKIEHFARVTPNAEAVVGTNISVSYKQLLDLVNEVATELRALKASRIALHSANCLEWVLVDLAAAMADVAVVPVPMFFSEEQIKHLLSNSGVDCLYTTEAFLPANSREFRSELLFGTFAKFVGVAGEPAPYAKVTYTSGSTGNPKGACLTGQTMLTIVESLAQALEPSHLRRHLCLLPFATLLENVAGIYLPLFMGRSLVVDDTQRLGLVSNHEFDVAAFANAVERYQIESVILLPQMLKAIVESDYLSSLTSLKFIAVGGGKVSPSLLQRSLELKLPVFEGYGLTECGSCVALNTPAASKIGSVGKPLAHAKLRISDSGEIMVTGAAMQGYLNDEVELCEIATGDAGFVDDEGFLHITGRIKNTIISSFGRNISPEWVESKCMAHPEIQQIAVFGEGKPYLSAVLVTAPGVGENQIQTVLNEINAELPDYARVVRWVRSVRPFSAIDKTLTDNGKLCREVIANRFSSFLNTLEGAA